MRIGADFFCAQTTFIEENHMFYRKPPGLFGPGFDSFESNAMGWTGPAPKPQPVNQPLIVGNSGHPVLDLISGLSQIFTRPKPTIVGYPDPTPTFPETQAQGGFGGDLPDYGSPRKRPGDIFDIDPGFSIGPSNDSGWVADRPVEYDEWGKPIKRYPMDERLPARRFPEPLLGQPDVEYAIARQPNPKPGFSLADAFGPAWTDDDGQNKWLDRWGIQPAQDARYLPDYPGMEDNSTSAQISRNWHDAYKQYAFDRIQENAPQFTEHAPQPQPQQSYGDFIGEMQNVASTLLSKGAGLLGSGIGQALGFIPGLGPIMELIGKGANIAGTVAGATGLGGEKAGTALNLLGSVANGAAGGASAGAEEYGPPMPRADQVPQETYGPAMPPFKNPTVQQEQSSWFKPLDQMIKEIDERHARGEYFDENNNWLQGPVPGASDQQKSVVFKQPGQPEPANNPNPRDSSVFQNKTPTPSKEESSSEFNKRLAEYNKRQTKKPNPASDNPAGTSILDDMTQRELDKMAPKPGWDERTDLTDKDKSALKFIFEKERGGNNQAQVDYAGKIHFPLNKSDIKSDTKVGVTLGGGDDWGDQTPEQVKNKLIKAGVAEDIAARASLGAGKKGQAAYDFVQQNKDLLKLTNEQQKSLFVDRYLQKKDEFLSKFDADTYRNMNKDQFTALMSLHYNTPAFIQSDTGIQRAIRNKSDAATIATEIKKWNKVGKNKIHPVLDARRKAEADLYLGTNQ
ncbi:MAG: hypothetical protein EYC62_01295 [Alphaproteobacteria bacterium]|nr:MAG: hypothetical protein EYC62_01295 [Alphaproteobacteria bacterium]